jgi:hypothetical protein
VDVASSAEPTERTSATTTSRLPPPGGSCRRASSSADRWTTPDQEASAAVREGADYLGLGPVFGTTSKSDSDRPIGVGGIGPCVVLDVPVVAIGGIDVERAADVIGGGCGGVAVIGAVMGRTTPAQPRPSFYAGSVRPLPASTTVPNILSRPASISYLESMRWIVLRSIPA